MAGRFAAWYIMHLLQLWPHLIALLVQSNPTTGIPALFAGLYLFSQNMYVCMHGPVTIPVDIV